MRGVWFISIDRNVMHIFCVRYILQVLKYWLSVSGQDSNSAYNVRHLPRDNLVLEL